MQSSSLGDEKAKLHGHESIPISTTFHSSSANLRPLYTKHSKSSRRPPTTTILYTDASNFRAIVQQFTGFSAPPSSPSPFLQNQPHLFKTPSIEPLSDLLTPITLPPLPTGFLSSSSSLDSSGMADVLASTTMTMPPPDLLSPFAPSTPIAYFSSPSSFGFADMADVLDSITPPDLLSPYASSSPIAYFSSSSSLDFSGTADGLASTTMTMPRPVLVSAYAPPSPIAYFSSPSLDFSGMAEKSPSPIAYFSSPSLDFSSPSLDFSGMPRPVLGSTTTTTTAARILGKRAKRFLASTSTTTTTTTTTAARWSAVVNFREKRRNRILASAKRKKRKQGANGLGSLLSLTVSNPYQELVQKLVLNSRLSRIFNDHFLFMYLTLLNLSFTNLKELPTAICELVELRHLCLSHTQIAALPIELTNLIKLKHLNLSYTVYLETIPRDVLGWLLRLPVLNLCHSGYNTCGIDLADLESLEQLSDLRIVSLRSIPALHSSLRSEITAKYSRDIGNDDCGDLTCFQLLSIFRNMKNLEGLGICNCEELEELIIGREVEREIRFLPSLGSLSLQYLFKLKTILAPYGSLQNLHFLNIVGCIKLKNVTWILHLQCLERISLHHCYGMEELIGSGVDGADEELRTFPRLKVIYIKSLPVLKSICKQTSAFPSLKYLMVSYCPKLKKLPLGLHSPNTLQEIRGEKEWWDGLEWKDESIKSAFHPYFIEYEEF